MICTRPATSLYLRASSVAFFGRAVFSGMTGATAVLPSIAHPWLASRELASVCKREVLASMRLSWRIVQDEAAENAKYKVTVRDTTGIASGVSTVG